MLPPQRLQRNPLPLRNLSVLLLVLPIHPPHILHPFLVILSHLILAIPVRHGLAPVKTDQKVSVLPQALFLRTRVIILVADVDVVAIHDPLRHQH